MERVGGDAGHKRIRSSLSEDEYDRAANARRDTINRAQQSWNRVADWFAEDHRDEANRCLLELCSDGSTDIGRLESFCRLRQLAGESYKARFSDSVSHEDIRTYTLELDGAGNLNLELSRETSAVLDKIFELQCDADEYQALGLAFTQTRAVAELVRRAWNEQDVDLDLYEYPFCLSLPALPDTIGELLMQRSYLLTRLPELPASLSRLSLERCQLLKTLPALPPSLTVLALMDAPLLTELPTLPNTLEGLWLIGCSSLVALPELPASLLELDLSFCESLATVSELPRSLRSLILVDCPDSWDQVLLQGGVDLPDDLITYIDTDGERLELFGENADFDFDEPDAAGVPGSREPWYESLKGG